MKRKLRIDVCDYSNRILCNLYDSDTQITGQAYDVFINYERNGWKELSFSIPSVIQTEEGEESNYRLDYLVADFRLRVTENDTDIDWYLVSEPKITHKDYSRTVDVRAGHISQILKTKNLELEFSDEDGNNVGTAEQFLTTILENTGWSVGTVAEFKEDDGSIKVRTMNASSKTGALSLISSLCELFDAKAIYHGNDKTVDLLPLNPFSEEYTEGVPEEVTAENSIELHYSKNVKGITRTLNTENLVTRLYAQGSYGDAVTGICNIQTCSHDEYTFSGIEAGNEYKFTDSTGATFYFYVPAEADVSGSVIWSKLDLLSRSYVWDEEKEQFYEVTKKRQTDQTSVELTAEPESKINYLPYLMSFDYYRKIGLLNDEQFVELAKYQRLLPKLYKDSQDAAQARADKAEELSRVAEPRNPFLKLSVSTSGGDVTSEDGHLSLKINSSVRDNGVIYRSDYDESKRNYFTWYVAGELKENGDPLTNLGSMMYIIHADNTWDSAYLEKIYNDEGLIVDENDDPTHYVYGKTTGSEPRRIVLHINYDDVQITVGDRFYLFCSNSMSGMLGVNMATDEAIVQSLQNQLTVETVKHPVFFSPVVDEDLIDQIPAGEYGWLYQSSIRTNIEVPESTLYYCNLGNGETTWRKVFTGEEMPAFVRRTHNGNYFFDLKLKTLWLGGNSKWVQMTTKKDERMSRAFSTVITMCAQRERVYNGWYEKYVRDGSLTVGNYAAKVGYDSFMLFSTDQTTSDTVTIDTTNSLVYQHPDDTQSVVSITTRTYDTVDFAVKNIFSDTKFNNGSISTTGLDISNDEYYRSGYVRVYAGVSHKCNVPADTILYYYDQNKTFLKRESQPSGEGTFVPPVASDIPQTIQTVDEYKAEAYWMRIIFKEDDLNGFVNGTYYAQLNGYETRFVVNDKLYEVLDDFTGEGEQLGIDPLMPKFGALADETYGTLLDALEAAQNAIKEANLSITDVLGDMLREGYWQDNNYAEGDEDRLYKDAMDNLKEISKPETTYDIEFLDLYDSNEDMEFSITDETGISWPDIVITDAVHLIDEDLDISCWGYIDKLNKCYDQTWKTTLEINTKLSLIDQHDFTDVMAHIADVAKETKAKQTLYQRAAALTGSGQLAAERLAGTISAYTNQITGGASNWYTDDNGNQVFLSADGQSAMMISGNGWCIANSKNKDGDWNWRTAATGSGVVADSITTGTLSATLIQAGAITTDKLSASVGQELEISSNVALTLYATADGSRPAGSLTTGKETEDEDGNPVYSPVEDGESYIQILPKTETSEAQIDIMSGGNININAGSALNMSGATMSVLADSYLNIESGGKIDIKSGSTFTVDSQNFKIKQNGNVEIEGKVTATSGKIAGFVIGQQKDGDTVVRDYMYSGTDSMRSLTPGVYLGTDGINVGGFLKASSDGAVLQFDGANISVDAATGAIDVKNDSTITVTSGKTLSLTSTNAVVSIGNANSPFTIGADKLGGPNMVIHRSYIYNGVTGINDTAHDGVYLGTDGIVLGKGQFKVLPSGRVDAKDLNLTGGSISITKIVVDPETEEESLVTVFGVTREGTLRSIAGTIGGWTIEADALHNGSDVIDDQGAVTSSTYVSLSTGKYALWAGREDPEKAPFSITRAGALVAASGKLGGWTVSSTRIRSGSNGTYVALDSGTSGVDYVMWAGNANPIDSEGNLSAKFAIKRTGEMYATGGTIGGWTIAKGLLSTNRSTTSGASAYVGLDSSSTLYALPGESSKSHMFAIWAGGALPKDAKFSVTKDGVVTIQKLRVRTGGTDKNPVYETVDFDKWLSSNDSGGSGTDTWAADISNNMGKLKFQTIKSISVSGTGRVTIRYTNNNGGTSSVGFNSAASATVTGKWSSYSEYGTTHGNYVAQAMNGSTAVDTISTTIDVNIGFVGQYVSASAKADGKTIVATSKSLSIKPGSPSTSTSGVGTYAGYCNLASGREYVYFTVGDTTFHFKVTHD